MTLSTQKRGIVFSEWGDMTCDCGNCPDQQGFYECTAEGTPIETPHYNSKFWKCDRCGHVWCFPGFIDSEVGHETL